VTTPPPPAMPPQPGKNPPQYPGAPGHYAPPEYTVPQQAPPAGYRPPAYQVPPGYQVPPSYAPPIAYGPLSPAGRPLADWGQRAVAAIIDGLLMGAIGAVVVLPIYIVAFAALLNSGSKASTTTATDGDTTVINDRYEGTVVLIILLLWLAMFVFIVAVQYFYEVEFTLRRGGQTIGKRVMKITVTPINPAETLTRGNLALRLFSRLGMGFIPFLSLIDVLFPLFDKPYQQALHDKAAKTVVVRL
jgi:uncharacterized RDD family membrane protein YckC